MEGRKVRGCQTSSASKVSSYVWVILSFAISSALAASVLPGLSKGKLDLRGWMKRHAQLEESGSSKAHASTALSGSPMEGPTPLGDLRCTPLERSIGVYGAGPALVANPHLQTRPGPTAACGPAVESCSLQTAQLLPACRGILWFAMVVVIYPEQACPFVAWARARRGAFAFAMCERWRSVSQNVFPTSSKQHARVSTYA